ncbi:hypothetical protein AB685_06690 [Bacillus sp. LL01]|uniref:hypothetical protein n=1 Tax=Bacillus sp. LL01 TaxID=1665556 RepID=UPI00064CFFF7|nr:hypothetical protein [Bacillus sp. LL01]KMJ58766.1 hypothetical protein AB685_06690 [Bacillus sp. LL01]
MNDKCVEATKFRKQPFHITFAIGFQQVGEKFVKPIYQYDNMNACRLWYHDHVIGITRLNIYALFRTLCLALSYAGA